VRHDLPFVAVVGNDATWNAEYQIQLRAYGEARAHGCELLPSRYDKVVEALGGHGEFVDRIDDLTPALERALAGGRPACVNVMIERVAAPVIRRGSA
jgi:acetolactate synthase-1/2/3 large subunit